MNAEFLSPAGKIISKWNIKEDGSVDFYFKVPFNTTAELVLPDTKGTDLQESYEIESGEYTFHINQINPTKKYMGLILS